MNEPPVVSAGVSYSGSEGSPIALNAATASDREGPIGSYSWTVDDTLCSFDDDSIVDPQLTCADNGTFAATLTVSDGYLSNSSTATVTVNNVDPTVTSLVVPWHEPIDIAEEALSSVDVTFFDPAGTNDNTYTCDFDLDYNGTTFASDASVSTSYGSCSTPLAYDSPGVYTVMVVVSDKDLGSDSATAAEFIVVFDPSGGFVTGGGWIDSPAGAYKDDETLKGKANFGFVAKYKKGANVPDGNTQFQFKAGDLNFHSSSYEWLVVAGNKAQFKGEGTINGEGSYMFKISADDDNPDTFRIHIWGDTGTVYDNGSQQELGGGSIKVHNGK